MEVKWTTDLNDTTYHDALAIRRDVFINEQQVPEAVEIDKNEDDCYHAVGYANGHAACTLRLFAKTPTEVKLQRFAVQKSERKKGLGKKLLLEAIKKAQAEGFTSIILGAQEHAIPFYEKLGFSLIDDIPYEEAGIIHKDMSLDISETTN